MADYEKQYPLEWIDEYVANIRDYVMVREADSLLIKVPNEAHKLNGSAVKILKRLLDGAGIVAIWNETGRDPAVRKDLYDFFIGVKQLLTGCANEYYPPYGVESRPYTLEFSKLPILSEIALTYRCNLRCRFCYAGCNCRKSDAPAQEEIGCSEMKRILDVIRRDAQVPSVSFTGGEPTLREDLEELITYARRELKMRVNLITNGTLIDESRAASLADAGLNSAQVSLEAPGDIIHDALTQCAGSFAKSVAAVNYLMEKNIHVHTNTTINRINFDCAAGMPAFAKSLGLKRFSMNLVIPAGSSKSGAEDINVRYEELPALILDIKREAERNGVEFMWYSPTPVCIFNPVQNRLGNKGCSACDGLLSVSPAGDVLPCSSWPEPVGNLLKDQFDKIWQSNFAKGLRKKNFASPNCASCVDFALCQGACPLYWEYFGDAELKQYGRQGV